MNRRFFIQQSIFLSGAVALTFRSPFLYAITGKKEITGKVLSNGKALSNVVISDGYSIVKTNNKGFYTLTTHPDAEFIFMSIPSGYEFPQEKSIARFYRSVKEDKFFDFELNKLNKNDSKHSFIVWADPQVKNEKDVKQMLDQSVPDVQQVIKELGDGELVHGIAVGDLVWDNHDLFPSYNQAVAEMGIPFFQGIGNHDMDYRLGGDETSDQTFKKHYGPTYFSFNRGEAHYVMLDNVRYLGIEREYDGFISKQQLDWLAEDLKYVSAEKLLIICLHIPVHNAVKNNTDLYSLLAPYQNAHIMSGHTHYNRNMIINNVYEHNHGAVCGAWWTGPVCEDGTPRGYGVYKVEGNTLKWYYKSTGLNKSEQLRIYVDELTNQKRLIANVWNWDPEWKVEYWADEKYRGLMENQKGFDPLAVQLYLGDKLPLTRSFAQPKKNDHIFVAHFSPEIKNVKVIVTDRFGQKYESEMDV